MGIKKIKESHFHSSSKIEARKKEKDIDKLIKTKSNIY